MQTTEENKDDNTNNFNFFFIYITTQKHNSYFPFISLFLISVFCFSAFVSFFFFCFLSLMAIQCSCHQLWWSFWKLSICLVLVLQTQIAFSALLMSLKNHHINHHHRRPMLQANQSTCALFVGTWVRDDSYPLYESSSCPIIDAEFNCQMYGRPDSDYLKYRWQPLNCELPR